MANLSTDFTFTYGPDRAFDLDNGIFNDAFVNTRFGDDSIRGSLFSDSPSGVNPAGIRNNGTIYMSLGNDSMIGEGVDGVRNDGRIYMGFGNDSITGGGNYRLGVGISNSGTINTGSGNDRVSAGGHRVDFGGGGLIDLGSGDDLLSGFGNQTVDGGHGFDKAEIEFNLGDLELGISEHTVTLSYDLFTPNTEAFDMTLANFELFEFNEGMFSFEDLAEIV